MHQVVKNQFLRISLLFYLVALLCYAWNYPPARNIIVYFYISCMIYICPTDRQKKFLEVTYNMDSKNFQTNQTQAMHYNFFNRENSFFILVSCFAISWQIWIWSTRIQIFSWSWPNFRKTKAPLTLFYIHSLSIYLSFIYLVTFLQCVKVNLSVVIVYIYSISYQEINTKVYDNSGCNWYK